MKELINVENNNVIVNEETSLKLAMILKQEIEIKILQMKK